MSEKSAGGGSCYWVVKPSGAQLANRRTFLHEVDFSNQDATSKQVVVGGGEYLSTFHGNKVSDPVVVSVTGWGVH